MFYFSKPGPQKSGAKIINLFIIQADERENFNINQRSKSIARFHKNSIYFLLDLYC